MRVLYLGNNRLGWKALEVLKSRGARIAGVVVHPEKSARHRDEIVRASGVPAGQVFDGSKLRDRSVLKAVAALKADLALSVLFGYIVRKPFLDLFRSGCINLHPAYLPYNRGAYPNVWSILEGTPAGVSLHYMDEGIDTGDLVAQERVPVDATETGESLYHKLEQASLDLLEATWPSIEAGTVVRKRQRGKGTVHRVADVERVDELKLDRTYTGRQVIDLLRARTFPPYRGAYFTHRGRKIQVRIQLIDEEKPKGNGSRHGR